MPTEIEIREFARLYAGMTPEQVAAHETWVAKYRLEMAEEIAQRAVAAQERRDALRAMSDADVVEQTVNAYSDADFDPAPALQVLQYAGFIRRRDLHEAVSRVKTVIKEFDLATAGHHLYGVPGIRHDLYRVLDFLTGEDHSGCTPNPAPFRGAQS
ncbi:hypothetical protein ASF27_12195 [Methylobacterium sp. Leaf102]|jgi:hypothetical protein|uniref:Uncharacterized protein n=2 Tax=Methylobacterium TaxID=407 RepID=A0A679IXI8_9HYPH|nr:MULTISPECIES: hypothetical protein [Methylobacterium]GJE17189.1 hypothetical protein AIGOOFII_1902 [Methylobacterium marchantiae]KQP18581.1 hypothetical protein ASF25_12070 [Methylobacterium sp. Leaf100]KQP23922.1 hypothetical protein ASF27_12195 [Methylobacterium sp. Leaf102]MBD8904682.1 hypothetical protein [Methylobacterium bullatum]CAA2104552.1 hypothetical protein MBUL_02761 [Methylobacterium bullatum]